MQTTSRYFKKITLFHIFNFANQLYYFKSTILDSPKLEKIYFSKNMAFNLLKKGKAIFYQEVDHYNLLLNKKVSNNNN